MRCIHSVVFALVLAEPLLISQLGNAFGTLGARRVEATN
jgi:hypothetical protein